MKKQIFSIILFFISIGNYAQNWTIKNPLPAFNLYSVHFIDSNTGWAVGSNGTIIKISKQRLWTTQKSGTTETLFSVKFINALIGWIVGGNGIILKTTNGGNTWIKQNSGITSNLVSIFPTVNGLGNIDDPNIIYAVGDNGTILKSPDAGINWTKQNSGTMNDLKSVDFFDNSIGYVVGNAGTILETVNGGTTWTVNDSKTSLNLQSIYRFLNGDYLAVGGNHAVLIGDITGWTTNYVSPNPYFYDLDNNKIDIRLHSICSLDYIYAVGDNGVVFTSKDAGSTWTTERTRQTTQTLNSVSYVNNTHTSYAVGNNGAMLSIDLNGFSWEISDKIDEKLNSVYFINRNTGWVVGNNNRIAKTLDGGDTWISLCNDYFGDNNIQSVYFSDINTGYAVGNNGYIIKTNDGGSTWSVQTSPTTKDLFSIKFVNAYTGWAVGDLGTILKTSNGGQTWISQTSGTSQMLLSTKFADINTGWATGANGTILKTINGGTTWTTQPSGTASNIYSIYNTDENSIYIVGDNGTILKSINGGTNWTVQNSGTTNNLNSVYFLNTYIGWAVGDNGTLIETYDGGLTWTIKVSGTTDNLYAFQYFDDSAWAVGDNGTILKRMPTLSGSHYVSFNNSRIFSRPDMVNNILNDYSLLQAMAWTWNGQMGIIRTLMKFNFSGYPVNTIILSAKLNLYGIGHNPLSHSNTSSLKLITKDWNYTNATWANMNNYYSNTGSVLIPGTTSSSQNATIDITNFVQYWISNPQNNYGMMFKLNDESIYSLMQYGSDNNLDATLKATLSINYIRDGLKNALYNFDIYSDIVQTDIITPVGISSDSTLFSNNISLSPIPANDILDVKIQGKDNILINYKIYNIVGSIVSSGYIASNQSAKLNVEYLKQGVYYISFKNNNTLITKKIAIFR